MTKQFKLDTKEVDRIINAMDGNKEKAGRAIAFEMEAEMKRRAARDTSAMANSVYTVTQKVNGYGQAAAMAHQSNKKAETEPHPKPSGDILARVGPSVLYAEYVENGTSRMKAQPFVVPAAEHVAKNINDGKYWRVLVE